MNVKVGDMEDITREGRIRRTRKEAVVRVQDMTGKKFLIKSEYVQKIEMISFFFCMYIQKMSYALR